MKLLWIPFLYLSFCLSNGLHAQVDKSNYELLWEVTGKNLTEPSYLFGTMHVRDVRAFEFSDSVLMMLDQCDAFAMEVHPDTIGNFYVDLLLNGDTTNILKATMSDRAYRELNEEILKKTGKPIDSLDVKDPFYLETLLSDFSEPEHTKKKAQFVDLYLCKQAWGQGKSIHGLEKMSDYLKVTSSFFDVFEKDNYQSQDGADPMDSDLIFNDFVELYRTGDLQALMRFMNQFPTDEDHNYELLNGRNYNMVKRFIAITQKESLFCTMGAAHLPGKEGVIDLLRKEGYQVRRVQPTFTGFVDRYVEHEREIKWNTHLNKQLAYQVETLGKALDITGRKASDEIDVFTHLDFLTMNNYIFMSFHHQLKELEGKILYDSLLQVLNDRLALEVTSDKKIERDGLDGRQYLFKNNDGSWCLAELYIRGKIVYFFSAIREDKLFETAEVEHYFDSIKFLELPKKEWFQFQEKVGAFEVQFPAQPKYQRITKDITYSNSTPKEVVSHSWVAVDPENNFNYVVRYNNYPAQIFVFDDDIVLTQSIDAIKARFQDSISMPTRIEWHGYPANDFVSERKDLSIYIKQLLRDNRFYFLMMVVPAGTSRDMIDPFFDSFQLLPLQQSEQERFSEPNGRFSMNFPTANIETEEENQSYPRIRDITYSGQDTASVITYQVVESEYSHYLEAEGMKEVQNSVMGALKNMKDIIEVDSLDFKGHPAYYMKRESNRENRNNYHLFFFKERFLYELGVYPPATMSRAAAFEFFNDFELNEQAFQITYVKDGTAKLFTDLTSTDTDKRAFAKKVIDDYTFETDDLPAIYQLLEKDFPNDTLETMTIHDLMLREFNYTIDKQTVPFLGQLFAKKSEDINLQKDILETLTGLKNKAAFEQFFQLAPSFQKDQSVEYVYKKMFQPLRDTLALTNAFFPQLVDLDQNQSLAYYSYKTIYALMRDKNISVNSPDELRKRYLQTAQTIFDQNRSSLDSADYFVGFYELDVLHQIIGELPSTPESKAYFEKALTMGDSYLLVPVIDHFLIHQFPVKRAIFDIVAENVYDWYRLLNNATIEETTGQIPSDLFEPTRTVEAYASNEIYNQYDRLSHYELLEVRPHSIKGEELNLYFYRFGINGYDGKYQGVCSQPLDGVSVYPKYHTFSGVKYDGTNEEALKQSLLEDIEGKE